MSIKDSGKIITNYKEFNIKMEELFSESFKQINEKELDDMFGIINNSFQDNGKMV